mmetsp:Transcript_43710/g.95152  ORF Transcript_43710/g.95152 Transcript_43710/m.95152 type:complete len:414 (-) Transcript_43710:77-1318(-)
MGGGLLSEELQAKVTRCVADIEVADLVALDFEFTGLFLDTGQRGRALTLEEQFTKCVESIPSFLPIQLGVCCARHRPETGVWELRAHELNLWPQDRRIFSADLQSLRFLRSHGFDFNSFLEKAHLYARLPPIDDENKKNGRPVILSGASRVISALRESRPPLIFHNALLDLLHLHDKFIGDVPPAIADFGDAWCSNFPLLFDTRYIAQEGRWQVLKTASGLSLEALHQHLRGSSGSVVFEHLGSLAANSPAHGSAAQDAQLTAEVFITMMGLWVRNEDDSRERGQGPKRRRKGRGFEAEEAKASSAQPEVAEDASGAAAGDASKGEEAGQDDGWTVVKSSRKRPLTSQGGFTPAMLESHPVCRRFHNRIAVMGAPPGFLDLGRLPTLQAPAEPASCAEAQRDEEAEAPVAVAA